jgi:hypothetical protein
LAGFRSAIFAEHGYQGSYPPRYYEDANPGVSNLSVIAFKIICNYINKRVVKNDVGEYLRLFMKNKVLKEISNEQLKAVTTVADLECLIKGNAVDLGNYATTILYTRYFIHLIECLCIIDRLMIKRTQIRGVRQVKISIATS